jgi:hypothetical protein
MAFLQAEVEKLIAAAAGARFAPAMLVAMWRSSA